MGYGDLSSYGHPLIRTPHIDRLAAEGQRWTSFYASSPLCNPSRIALATGRMPIRIQGGELNRWSNLPAEETTLGDMFQAAGFSSSNPGNRWARRASSPGGASTTSRSTTRRSCSTWAPTSENGSTSRPGTRRSSNASRRRSARIGSL
ncbi:MAG: sulfatase-like hydrolase/transferase [Acidobacteria bacterium]|nr:sulfatase-like hydrolase/transferase [Acidobacteriota bacterium]